MKLLIVDDKIENIEVAKKAINDGNIDVEVLTALSGEEGLEIIKKEDISVLLLDVTMVGMDGIEVLEKLQTEIQEENLKVLMLTSVTNPAVLEQCFELGTTDYIRKPFEPIKFIVRIKSVLKKIENEKTITKALELLEKQNVEQIRTNNILRENQTYIVEKEKMQAVNKLAKGYYDQFKEPVILLEKAIEKYRETDISNEEFISKVYEYSKDLNVTLAKLEYIYRNSKKLELGEFPLEEIIRDAVNSNRKEIEVTAKIVMDFADVPLVRCNRAAMEQVIVNLLLNSSHAIDQKFTDGKGTITIKTFVIDDGSTMCMIRDNGIGIEEDEISKIYDPFYSTKDSEKTDGIGLSIVHDIIVKRHKGCIDVNSKIGEGTDVTFVIPKFEEGSK